MTDKQIIVNGVDVNGCKYLYITYPERELNNKSACYAESERCVKMIRCEACPNCYYKQLKRKEQECEELKKAEEYDSRYNDLQAEIDCGNAIIEKYEKCLNEIKEIAEEAGNTQYLTFPDFDLKQNAYMLMGQFNGYLQQILQKISEYEVVND